VISLDEFEITIKFVLENSHKLANSSLKCEIEVDFGQNFNAALTINHFYFKENSIEEFLDEPKNEICILSGDLQQQQKCIRNVNMFIQCSEIGDDSVICEQNPDEDNLLTNQDPDRLGYVTSFEISNPRY